MTIRTNGQAPLLASQMYPNKITIGARETRAACPVCDCWHRLGRGGRGSSGRLLWPHTANDGIRCPGSGQPIVVNLSQAEWLARLDEAIRDAARIRAARVHPKAQPPVAPPLCRMTGSP